MASTASSRTSLASVRTTGLKRSECPTKSRAPPARGGARRVRASPADGAHRLLDEDVPARREPARDDARVRIDRRGHDDDLGAGERLGFATRGARSPSGVRRAPLAGRRRRRPRSGSRAPEAPARGAAPSRRGRRGSPCNVSSSLCALTVRAPLHATFATAAASRKSAPGAARRCPYAPFRRGGSRRAARETG